MPDNGPYRPDYKLKEYIMRRSILQISLCLLCLAAAVTTAWAQWPTIEKPEVDPIESITRFPEGYLDYMDGKRRNAGGAGLVYIWPDVVKRAKHYRDMLDSEGPAALARAMVDAYPSDNASKHGTAFLQAVLRLKNRFNSNSTSSASL